MYLQIFYAENVPLFNVLVARTCGMGQCSPFYVTYFGNKKQLIYPQCCYTDLCNIDIQYPTASKKRKSTSRGMLRRFNLTTTTAAVVTRAKRYNQTRLALSGPIIAIGASNTAIHFPYRYVLMAIIINISRTYIFQWRRNFPLRVRVATNKIYLNLQL